jgi:hypothetical protein
VSVHRRLKLIAFPTRTGAAETARPDPRPLRFRCAPFVRDGVFDNGRATAPRNIGAAHVAFGCVNGLGLCDFVLSRLNSPPHTIAVYASPRTSPPATQHSLPSRRYPLLGRDFHPLDHISFPDALTLASILYSLCEEYHSAARSGQRVDRPSSSASCQNDIVGEAAKWRTYDLAVRSDTRFVRDKIRDQLRSDAKRHIFADVVAAAHKNMRDRGSAVSVWMAKCKCAGRHQRRVVAFMSSPRAASMGAG